MTHTFFHRTLVIYVLIYACLFNCNIVSGQRATARKSLMLVTSFGSGGVDLPVGSDWKPELLTVYDEGRRPVAQFSKGSTGITASFILFENLSGTPSARGCRDDVINAIVAHDGKLISKRIDGQATNALGEALATTSYLVDMGSGGSHQYNLFGFAGDPKMCAEIHLSGVGQSPANEEIMRGLLSDFRPNLAYQPASADYFLVASVLFKRAPGLSAPYYKASLDAMPKDGSQLTPRRIATDQLVMALGMTGKIKDGRVVAEEAVAADPDYPINYYNLACIDAEQGDVAGARAHLKQAFDRRANVLKGESMPDPTQDDSILKLKKDQAFWAFVQALPKN
jgi:hypothetical protein